jgi:hypothetical protein
LLHQFIRGAAIEIYASAVPVPGDRSKAAARRPNFDGGSLKWKETINLAVDGKGCGDRPKKEHIAN